MKLYAFQPGGFGALSYFVMAESKDAALEAIKKVIPPEELENPYDTNPIRNPQDYSVTEAEAGEVVTNDNS